MATRWKLGILGKVWTSEEHLVASDFGSVVRARSVKACPEKVSLGQLLRIKEGVTGVTQSWTMEGEKGPTRSRAGTELEQPDSEGAEKEEETTGYGEDRSEGENNSTKSAGGEQG